jgi:hypothetical protein
MDPSARVVVVAGGLRLRVGPAAGTAPPAPHDTTPSRARRCGRCVADIIKLLDGVPRSYSDIVSSLAERHADSTIRNNIARLAGHGMIRRRPDGLYGLPDE